MTRSILLVSRPTVGVVHSVAAPPEVKLISVTKISDRAPHSAFTDLIYWKDQFVCAFREGRASCFVRRQNPRADVGRTATTGNPPH